MDKKYIYSTSRVRTLQTQLLSEQQLERMVNAKSAQEAFLVLNDTFLAPFVAGIKRSELPRALRKSVSATKKLLDSIAPSPGLLNVLWYKYDFYNLTVIVKGLRVGLNDEQIEERCYFAGSIPPRKILEAIRKENFASLFKCLARAARRMESCREVYDIDRIANEEYFASIRRIAEESRHPFVLEYVKLLIDFYNIRTQLRLHIVSQFSSVDRRSVWVGGGTVDFAACRNVEGCLNALSRFGGQERYRQAIEAVLKDKNFALLEKAADDYLRDYLVSYANTHIFDPSPLFAYFVAHRADVAVIKTVMAAKEGALQIDELRKMLRKLY